MNTATKDQFRGCLIGQCLGDALGYPIEGEGPDVCNNFVFNRAKIWFEGATPTVDQWYGQYTDDSQLARELLASLVENEGFSPVDYAERIAAIFGENRIVGRGIATDQAAMRLNSGVHWRSAGCPPPSAGNGTAMRAAPAGMLYYDRPEALARVAHEQGFITHQDPRCSAGSVAIAGAVALAMQGQGRDPEAFADRLAEWMRPFSIEFAELVLNLPGWVLMKPHEVDDLIASTGRGDTVQDWPGISPFVIPSVLWSLYSYLRYPDNYWEAISTALSVGGDVDTTGAMTGAIAGAAVGYEALPSNLTRLINDRGTWTEPQLLELCDACHELAVVGKRDITQST